MLKPKECIYSVLQRQLLTKKITKIILQPASKLHLYYQAGQYIKIMHPDGKISPLSIANAPNEKLLLELHLTHPADNLPAQEILRFMASEKKLVLRGPYGSCTAEKLYGTQPIIFLARGTGFAPIKAIIEEMLKYKKIPPMHFYWSVKSPEEFYSDDLLTLWLGEIKNFTFTKVLSRVNPQWAGRVGLLQDVVLQDYGNMEKFLVYVTAPEPVVHDVLPALQAVGLKRENYYSDVFDYALGK